MKEERVVIASFPGYIVIPVISAIIFLIFVLMYKTLTSLSHPNSTTSNLEQKLKPVELVIPVKYKINITDVNIIKDNVLVTCYTNTPRETDSTPNITATGRLVYSGCCAVSQDMFRKTVFPGDLVYVVKLNKWFIVEDTTNERHKKLIDIFCFKDEPPSFSNPVRSDVYILHIR